jgi:hypothetical protein
MMSSEMSCMASLEKVGMLYVESNGMPQHQEFHYEPIST